MTYNLIWLTNVIVDGWLGLMTDCWRRFGSPRHTHTHTLSQVSWWADCCSLNSDSAHCHVERRGSPLTCVSAPLCTEHSGAPGLFFFFLCSVLYVFFLFLFFCSYVADCLPADRRCRPPELNWRVAEVSPKGRGLRYWPPLSGQAGAACGGPPWRFPKPTLFVLYCTHLQVPVCQPHPLPAPPRATWRKPCRCIYRHLYKCTSLRKKMKPWHICNLRVSLSLLDPITKHTFSSYTLSAPTK